MTKVGNQGKMIQRKEYGKPGKQKGSYLDRNSLKKKKSIKQIAGKGILAFALLWLSAYLLDTDVWTFWTWWLLAGLMGLAAMPVTGLLFSHFEDRGWIFSKVIAITVTGFLTWFLVAVGLVPFRSITCIVVTAACAVLCFLLFRNQTKRGISCLPEGKLSLVFWEEIVFFAAFLMWTYLAGFHPAASGGTEKFMDYGFMATMMRSDTLPAADLWYSEGTVNYYYGGQYFAVFLTKLSGTTIELTYNLMRTFVAGLAFVMPFSLVYQMAVDRRKKLPAWKAGQTQNPGRPVKAGQTGAAKKAGRAGAAQNAGHGWVPAVSGLTAGVAVSIAGNMHYVIYGNIIPWIEKLTGQEVSSYWFPDATRYIGYNPDVADKTIHEFPCYSFVLGDLHAHVVNIMFVLCLVGILYAWLQGVRPARDKRQNMGTAEFWKKNLLIPHVLLAALFLGIYQWTNFWDFVIYFVVTGGVVLFGNIVRFGGKVKKVFAVTAAQAAEVLVIAYLVILPFTMKFESMVDGVALAQNHSLFYQLLVLWGLPASLVVLFVISVCMENLKGHKKKSLYRLLARCQAPDLFAAVMGLCALGLVAIPEIVYVRDIYENGYARANTMFKLTYQAYILFGLTMGYGIYRLIMVSRQKIFKICACVILFFLAWTVGYFGNSVNSWFGDVWDVSQYQGLDASAFLATEYPEDVGAINWLKENVEGTPVVLEANGDSYTAYCRVSSQTGLPTILGWYVHEWLWRQDTDDLNEKSADVQTIYTSTDEAEVRELLADYDVSYIFVGTQEREKYGENLNNSLLQSLGEIVYQDENSATYIVKVS